MKIIHSESPFVHELSMFDFAGYSAVSLADARLLNAGKAPPKTVIVADDLESNQVVANLLTSGAASVVQKNKANFVGDLKKTAELIQNPVGYFDNPISFLAGGEARSLETTFTTSLDKPNLKREFDKFLTDVQNQNVVESGEAILEEFYMNAMLDAPREAARLGQSNCSYDMGMHGTFRFALTPSRLFISCDDPFGSLDIMKFIKRMNEVYCKGAGASINFREGGAGLGCVIIFEHCEALYLGVKPGERTLVTAVIPVGMSYRQRAQVKKSLHLVTV